MRCLLLYATVALLLASPRDVLGQGGRGTPDRIEVPMRLDKPEKEALKSVLVPELLIVDLARVPLGNGQVGDVRLDGKTARFSTDEKGSATVYFAWTRANTETVTLEYNIGTKKNSVAFRPNSSGHVQWDLSSSAIAQWPLVTWESTRDTLDVLVDGQSAGSTSLSRGVAPGLRRFEWRKGSTVVCSHTESLSANSRRTYTCDVFTKTVR